MGVGQTLTSLVKDYGVFEGSRKLVADDGDVCLSFALQYFLAQVLLIVAALSVVVINVVLKVRERAPSWLCTAIRVCGRRAPNRCRFTLPADNVLADVPVLPCAAHSAHGDGV